MKVLITCSGTGSRMGKYTEYTNKALIKIGDKFTIDYIIDNFKLISNVEFIISLGYYGDFVKQYLTIAYPELNFTYVSIDKYEGKGSSQGYSLLQCKNYLQDPFIFIACDTIILDNLFDSNHTITSNTIYSYNYKNSTSYSSIKCQKNKIISIHDKGELNIDYIYIGMTEIFNYQLFWDNLENIYKRDIYDLSLGDINVYAEMLDQNIEFNNKIVKEWYDAGNINIFNKKINKNCNYNVLTKYDESISFLEDKVIKFFYSKDKNIKRVQRGELLNDIVPKIFNSTDNFHSMEKINSRPISEIYKNDLIYKLLNWSQKNLWIKYETPKNFKTTLYKFYYQKTIERIKKALNQNIPDYPIINDINIGNIYDLIAKINFDDLYNSESVRFHGDFILDNILIDDSENFILIDWRQDFGNDLKNGDIYYDFAKLKHNIYLNHHNLENDLYELKEINKNSCVVDIKCNYFLINQINRYESFIKENNYDNKKINILMSLIWINMAPLHTYPLNNFLFNFGKYNLYQNINLDKL
jgi:choline kinase